MAGLKNRNNRFMHYMDLLATIRVSNDIILFPVFGVNFLTVLTVLLAVPQTWERRSSLY